MFLVADVSKLEVWASVHENDIGKIHEKQRAQLKVFGCPGKVFQGEVRLIRLDATLNQSAVTYTVVITIEKPTNKLLPYMTAEVEFY
jgi:HlyD family secretion protein